MSRVTPPVTKFTHIIKRSISSSPHTSRLSVSASEAREPELLRRLSAHDARSHSTMGSNLHRPTTLHPTRPLMQGFKTSAPKQAIHDKSTIDYCFFPSLRAIEDAEDTNPFARLRVPLLPDNVAPNRSVGSVHANEVEDMQVQKAEISIVAAHPEMVLPVAMSEVVANDGEDAGTFMAGLRDRVESVIEEEKGMLRELWGGLVDDVLGPKAKPTF